jgi:tRNA(Ile)-lysidine synthase
VQDAARALALDHATLRWEAARPASGLQEAAREARRALLFAHARTIGADAVAMAHTADDQAETLLMRLARGSGLDGIAGMAPITSVGPGLALVRPLLTMTRERVEAILRARGVSWIEDPSNTDTAFERVRIRNAQAMLAGVGLAAEPLATSARRLLRARQALDDAAIDVLDAPDGPVSVDALGFATLDWPGLSQRPAEVRLRVLAGLIETIGGTDHISLAALEAMTEGRNWASPAGLTIGRVLFRKASGSGVMLLREPDRLCPPAMRLSGPGRVLFDGRFEVSIDRAPPVECELRALADDGLATLRASTLARSDVSRDVLVTLPSLWIAGELAAVPLLGAVVAGQARDMVNMRLRRAWLRA